MTGFIHENQLDSNLKEKLDYIDELRKMHDKDYALKCLKDALLKEYRSMVMTDIWYEAAKKWVDNKIESHYQSIKSPWFYDGCLSYSNDGNVILASGDGRWIDLMSIHNEKVELEGYEFEKFCISYKNEKENKSSI